MGQGLRLGEGVGAGCHEASPFHRSALTVGPKPYLANHGKSACGWAAAKRTRERSRAEGMDGLRRWRRRAGGRELVCCA